MTSPEEAKYYRDKFVLDEHGNKIEKWQATAGTDEVWPTSEGLAMGFGVGPENYDRYHLEKSLEPLNNYKKVVKQWLHYEDDEVLDVILASMIGEKTGGDPIWLFLIAPPGGTKTEILRSFTGNWFYPLSDMTSKTLITGLMVGEGEKRRKVKDLLPELDGKVLIFKDFTTILEKGRDERREIIAQFREAYDGSFSKKVGTTDNVISYLSRFGLVAGVTPIIDLHWKLMQQLGERFLKIRSRENVDAVTKKARENEGQESLMRERMQKNAQVFLDKLDFEMIPEFDDEKFGDDISQIAKFVAFARTPISSSEDSFQEYVPIPEMPTRLVKQFKKLAKCLAKIRGRKHVSKEDMFTIIRVAKDTIPPSRLCVLETVAKYQKETEVGCSRNTIVQGLKESDYIMSETTVRRVLEQLKMLNLVEEKVQFTSEIYPQKMYFYKTSGLYHDISDTLPKKYRGIKEPNKCQNCENLGEFSSDGEVWYCKACANDLVTKGVETA